MGASRELNMLKHSQKYLKRGIMKNNVNRDWAYMEIF